jgi:hypothetical protein
MQGPSRLKKAPHLQENLIGQLSMSRRIRKELEDTKETKIKHSCGLWTHRVLLHLQDCSKISTTAL